MTCFKQEQLQAIADALGDTADGLAGSEITHLLASSRITDVNPAMTKRLRLYNAFAEHQNKYHDRIYILAFIRKAMKPERFAREPERFEPMRANLNKALAFAGLAVDETGALQSVEQARTLSEAQARAQDLKPAARHFRHVQKPDRARGADQLDHDERGRRGPAVPGVACPSTAGHGAHAPARLGHAAVRQKLAL